MANNPRYRIVSEAAWVAALPSSLVPAFADEANQTIYEWTE